ncbi:hypothetical protein PIB30_051153 [Stylosanthes scabra]|uniref:RIN4 pathogenic type III effector avirulence factor Avr cleavage site domain-containing protein n=1 Tax=Stylosanthes scabra TaxID=79078 RepID=A0ABU6QHF7_9FABA|nr:hypothetical protein [Stylosanthes scabra]
MFHSPAMDEWKRSGQIPAFGNWEFANEMPITQYFECARQAGLVRYSSSSGESDPCVRDLYSHDFHKPPPPSTLKKGNRNREREKRCSHGNVNGNMRKLKQGKVWDVTEQQRSKQQESVPFPQSVAPSRPKPVDEDLYKIPPQLLRSTKRKKVLGFISKCLVPAACVS